MVSSVDIKNNVDNKPIIRRVASASAIGTAAEYYDFLHMAQQLYSFLAIYFSQVMIR